MDILNLILPPLSALLGVGLGAWGQHRAEAVREEKRRHEAWMERTFSVLEGAFAAVNSRQRSEVRQAASRLTGLSIAHIDAAIAKAALEAALEMDRVIAMDDTSKPVQFDDAMKSLAYLAARARAFAYGEDSSKDLWGRFLDRDAPDGDASAEP